jgi:hypothetical protein
MRRGAAGSAAVLIAGASMWLSNAPTLAKAHDENAASSHGQSNHDGPGDSNRGDVWTDNVGQPSGPGHEQDTHLACADINLWGDKMGDSGDAYTIDSWPPSGNKSLAYSSTWSYDQAQGGPQVISVINVKTLVASAQAAGAAPANKNGYHFKLELTQDPQKHKTFWVSCPAPAPTPTPTPKPTPTPTPGGGGTEGTGNGGGGGGGTEGTGTGGSVTPPSSGVQAATIVVGSPSAPAQQGVLGAATNMPTTGRVAILGALLLAIAMVIAGGLVLRRSRSAN